MILIIDHRDSFTHNLAHLLSELAPVRVRQAQQVTDQDLAASRILVFSPGAGQPRDYPDSLRIYRSYRQQRPILGVCLGFQLILVAEGAAVIRQPRVLHGVQTTLSIHAHCRTYDGVPLGSKVGRYHSLAVDPHSIPTDFLITSTDPDTHLPLSFEHSDLPIYGVQYHPESFLTDHGHIIIRNLLAPHLGS